MKDFDFFIGIDVQIKRGCSYFVFNRELERIDSGWAKSNKKEIAQKILRLANTYRKLTDKEIAIGIDSPRLGLREKRKYYWNSGKWEDRNSSQKGYGRHCEVVISALKIANPQWTPLVTEAPEWMILGFSLFNVLENFKYVYEIFPTASYNLLQNQDLPNITINLKDFFNGPKDMLDACVGALTVHQFIKGQGSEVGGGDGLGTIILPSTLPVLDHPVFLWPE